MVKQNQEVGNGNGTDIESRSIYTSPAAEPLSRFRDWIFAWPGPTFEEELEDETWRPRGISSRMVKDAKIPLAVLSFLLLFSVRDDSLPILELVLARQTSRSTVLPLGGSV